MTAAVSETTIDRNASGCDDECDADDVEQEQRRALHDPVADVLERRRLARYVRDGISALRMRDVGAGVVDADRPLALSCGAVVGVTKTMVTDFASLNCGSPTDATPARFWTPS